MRVRDLLPGMIIKSPIGQSATVIAVVHPHPLYPDLSLVVWRMDDGGTSLDALSPIQEVGEPQPWTEAELRQNLRDALHGGA